MKKVLAQLMVLAMLMSVFAACGNAGAASERSAAVSNSAETATETESNVGEHDKTTPEPTQVAAENIEPEAEETSEVTAEDPEAAFAEAIPAVLPLTEEPETLTLYDAWNPTDESLINSMDEYLTITAAEEMTNVHIEWTSAPGASYSELFNLMCAAGDLRDIIAGFNYCYTSGVSGAIQDELIINLKRYMEDYAPAYSAQIDELDYGWAQVSADEDTVGAFYTLSTEVDYRGIQG